MTGILDPFRDSLVRTHVIEADISGVAGEGQVRASASGLSQESDKLDREVAQLLAMVRAA